ncbi:conserved protein of unknown function [Modestobacter italicus]|uniref:DUF4365 domain-containing protein n=1 Tax=Modestobacter italicus (strain DSM 44449 / CECT 9708 / BC 501) TaxID=2732864 RepID=I4EUS8_MODI5|nr:DUF4365 domain-containing protein [Modestobacter marinus]CCH87141.1 conserved protein of unknown function [Modestobacter marinus]
MIESAAAVPAIALPAFASVCGPVSPHLYNCPMRRASGGKRISSSHVIGEAGIALIALRTAEMGHVWHQRQTDAGIDGEIELRDRATGEVRNLVVMVQSKASDQPFPGETDGSFHYIVDARDLEYWLGGNAPVILICSHPRSQEAWWVHINAWFDDPARQKSRRVVFDKGAQAYNSEAAEAIARLAAPAGSGIYLGLAPRGETIISNLLPLEATPARIFSVPLNETRLDQLGPALRKSGVRRSDWIVHGGQSYSFGDFAEPGWEPFLSGAAESRPAEEWLGNEDSQVQRLCAQLLTRSLLDDLHHELAWHGKKKLIYFKATRDLRPRTLPGKARERVVFKGYPNKKDPSRVAYYRHSALRLGYVHDGDTWYAQLDPTYVFTSDGRRDSLYAADNLAGIRRLEKAAAVEGSVRMWASYIRGDKRRIGDPERTLTFGDLREFEAEFGIDDSGWRGRPRSSAEVSEEADVEPVWEAADGSGATDDGDWTLL